MREIPLLTILSHIQKIVSPKTGEVMSGAFFTVPDGNQLYDTLMILSGLFWSIAYVMIIFRGVRDKACGMPFAVLTLNIAWELIYSIFGHPIVESGSFWDLSAHPPVMRIVDAVWLALDCGIIYIMFRYGKDEFRKFMPFAPKKAFAPVFAIYLVLALVLVFVGIFEWNDHYGMYIAYISDTLRPILFIRMLYLRGNADGQSMGIAIFTYIGTLLTIALGGIVARQEYGVSRQILMDIRFMPLMKLFIVVIITSGLAYIILLYRTMKYKLKLNPWTRRPLKGSQL